MRRWENNTSLSLGSLKKYTYLVIYVNNNNYLYRVIIPGNLKKKPQQNARLRTATPESN